ncbi:MAG: DUF3987 domain-containing protein [Patescibacteria group bacterium]|nr:DUF3987 domain-containing protein [Patescibacteria group bacterium]
MTKWLKEWEESGINKETSQEYIDKNFCSEINKIEAGKRLKNTQILSSGWFLEYPEFTENKKSGYGVFKPEIPRKKLTENKKERILKYERPFGQASKLFRPIAFNPDKLSDIKTPLCITEGEKKAIKLTQEGFNCISIGGVWNWRTSSTDDGILLDFKNISFLGRKVYLVFDNDIFTKEAVKKALNEFSKYLLSQGATVYIVFLPYQNEKLGIDDYLVKYGKENFKKILTRIIPDKKKGYTEIIYSFFEPEEEIKFPLEALPKELTEYIKKESSVMDAPPEFIATGLLAGAAAILNKNVKIKITQGWSEYAILWMMNIAVPGKQKKSPCFEIIKQAIDELDETLKEDYLLQKKNYKKLELEYQKNIITYKKSKLTEPPEAPEEPNRQLIYVSDTTVEGLIKKQDKNEQGIAILVDELGGFFKSINQYKSNGNDTEYFLSAWKGATHIRNRVSDKEPISIKAVHNIFGAIPPKTVIKMLFNEIESSDGFYERWLYTISDYKSKCFLNRNESSFELREKIKIKIKNLSNINKNTIYNFSDEATIIFDEYYSWLEKTAHQSKKISNLEISYLIKQQVYTARFSLILHCFTNPELEYINPETVLNAIKLSGFFINCFKKFTKSITKKKIDNDINYILEYMKQREKQEITARELNKLYFKRFTRDKCIELFKEMEDLGLGKVIPQGRSSKFILI